MTDTTAPTWSRIAPGSPPLPAPEELYIEVTNRCNSLCTTCIRTFQTREPEKDLTFDEFVRVVDQLPGLRKAWMHGIGEPTLNGDLVPMVRHLKARGVYVLFNSNIVKMPPALRDELILSGVDEIRISLDGATPETYQKLRGVRAFDKVVRHARELVAARQRLASGTPRLSFWLTGIRENVAELPRVIALAADCGIEEVHLQRMTYFGAGLAVADQAIYRRDVAGLHTMLAECELLARQLGVAFSGSGALPPAEHAAAGDDAAPWRGCTRPLRLSYLSANGNVLPCCISPWSVDQANYADIILGNAFETPVEAIWSGDRYQAFRTALDSNEPPEPCRNCGVGWSL